MSRKTFEVQDIQSWANERLADPKLSQAEKRGVAMTLERILLDTQNYHGFGWVNDEGMFRPLPPDHPEVESHAWSRCYYMR